jgi:hypothetical protein
MRQYSDKGRLGGISGLVDLDVLYSDGSTFFKAAYQGAPKPVHIPEKMLTFHRGQWSTTIDSFNDDSHFVDLWNTGKDAILDKYYQIQRWENGQLVEDLKLDVNAIINDYEKQLGVLNAQLKDAQTNQAQLVNVTATTEPKANPVLEAVTSQTSAHVDDPSKVTTDTLITTEEIKKPAIVDVPSEPEKYSPSWGYILGGMEANKALPELKDKVTAILHKLFYINPPQK